MKDENYEAPQFNVTAAAEIPVQDTFTVSTAQGVVTGSDLDRLCDQFCSTAEDNQNSIHLAVSMNQQGQTAFTSGFFEQYNSKEPSANNIVAAAPVETLDI